ncbi:MAG: carboxynorspermidine decarboxylase, partial [Eubacteriales bacterium]
LCDHIIFNSIPQLERFSDTAHGDMFGLRLNPEHSTQTHGIYDPCSPRSRLGVTNANLRAALAHNPQLLDGVAGYHMHTLCEQGFAPLAETFERAEALFGDLFSRARWLNLGGGHHITRDDYDRDALIAFVRGVRQKYGVTVYLEPGEAVALDAGYLAAQVIDVFENGTNIAILDVSAACHMPDVLEMPYRPNIIGAGEPDEKPYTYRLGGPTCLAGDIIGDYSFDRPLCPGDRLVFCDMAIYSMVKNNTFNGMPLPSICTVGADRVPRLIKRFGYADFEGRLS